MPYSQFTTLNQAIAAFDLRLQNKSGLFATTTPIPPSEWLTDTLDRYLELATNIGTEKAKSELIVTPVLLEIYGLFAERISYFSGITLTVDASAGLNGECDFILSGDANQIEVSAPILTIVEAKNDDIKSGIGQCVAQMVGAQRFNGARGQHKTIYGGVTTGEIWKFMKLEGDILWIDLSEFFITQLPKILGILSEPFHNALET